MGLIRAAFTAVGGTLSDQWLEFFHLDSMPENVLMTRGHKTVGGQNRGNDNVISNGSGIAVNKGQCMMIIDQGRVMDVCAEPGLYTWNQSSEPTVFAGSLGESIKRTIKTIGHRFSHGGIAAKEQRVYYFNIKELMNNKFGSVSPIPFRVVDRNIGLDIDITIRCNGIYSYKIADPLLFYTNVSGNVAETYTRDMLDTQLKSEFISALKPAFSKMSEMGLRYSALPGHTAEMCQMVNEVLSEKWRELRGLEVVAVAFNSLSAPKEDEDLIKELQRNAVMRDPSMAGATLVNAQAQAMQSAASNTSGVMTGFMGLGMAQPTGGTNPQGFYTMGQQNQPPAPAPTPQASTGWTCACGVENTGRFCQDCGGAKPASNDWTCNCGMTNSGRFCQDCGTPKPVSDDWICECGIQNKGKFCQDCGNPRQ